MTSAAIAKKDSTMVKTSAAPMFTLPTLRARRAGRQRKLTYLTESTIPAGPAQTGHCRVVPARYRTDEKGGGGRKEDQPLKLTKGRP